MFISKGTRFEYTDINLPIHKRIPQTKIPYGDREKAQLLNAQ